MPGIDIKTKLTGSSKRMTTRTIPNKLVRYNYNNETVFYRYIIVENLRYFLSAFNTSEPMWFGHKYKTNVTAGFHSGGAGR